MRKLELKRKIHTNGGCSLLVTLPRLWADIHELERGDKVLMIVDEHKNLLVQKWKQ